MKARDIVRPAKLLETRNRIIKSAMNRVGIETQRDISRHLNMKSSALPNRFTGKVQWDIDELRKLDRAVHFEDAELLKLIRG